MKFGIAISTLNRREVFLKTLAAYEKYSPPGTPIFVVDDGSDVPVPNADHRNPFPRGIANVKNHGIRLLMDAGVDHLFLSDDDCHPTDLDWWKPYVESGEAHLSYLPHNTMHIRDCRDLTNDVLLDDGKIWAVREGSGCLLYFTRECINRVGGMRPEFGRWSDEHRELSHRIRNCGLIRYPFQDVKRKDTKIWSLDSESRAATPGKVPVRGGSDSCLPEVIRTEYRKRNAEIFDKYCHTTDFVDYHENILDITNVAVAIPWRPQPDRIASHDRVSKYWAHNGFQVIDADSDPRRAFVCNQARNNAVRQAHSDIIIIADGDTLPANIIQVRQAIEMVALGEVDIVWPFTVYRSISGDAIDVEDLSTVRSLRDYTHGSPGGIIVANRKAYWSIGGYDELFIPGAWAFDDTAFMLAAQTLLTTKRLTGMVYSFDHTVDNAGKVGRVLNESPNKPRYELYEFANGKPTVMRELIKGLPTVTDPRYDEIYRLMLQHTMSPYATFVTNLALAEIAAKVPGAIVECGVWRGGMIGGIATLLGNDRDYFLFDSFEGLPPVEDIDGPFAKEWLALPGHDNCTAAEAEAVEAMKLSGADKVHIFKGWFNETLQQAEFPDGIAFLRIDADWYTSMRQVMDALFPLVNTGGIICIDDYYFLDGCAKATHDYLSQHQLSEKIEVVTDAAAWEMPTDGVCFIKKL